MHRLQKLALAGGLLAIAVAIATALGPDRPGGKAALLGSALLTGALMALFGQIYQTGADPFELFAWWALLILPWVIVSRFAPMWLLWIGLLNTAALMYFQARAWGLLGILFGVAGTVWILFAINVTALITWETALARGIPWLQRWGARGIGFLAGGVATFAGVVSVIDSRELGAWSFPLYLAWAVAMYYAYRVYMVDVFMLSGLVLSGIIVITAFLSEHLLHHSDAGGFLLIGLILIALSAAGGWWIRQVMKEQPA